MFLVNTGLELSISELQVEVQSQCGWQLGGTNEFTAELDNRPREMKTSTSDVFIARYKGTIF